MLLYYILIPFAWLLWHIGFRIRVEGRENLKKVQTQGYILAPTHVSAIDPVFIVITRWGRRMVVFAKKELFEINAFLTWFFRCCGGVVPCRILYDTPDGKMHLFCKVRVIYGEPMPAAQFAMEGRRDTKKLRANKQALLDAWEKMGR